MNPMYDLNTAINTLSALYLTARDKGYEDFALEVKPILIGLLREQNITVVENVRRLQSTYSIK
jgi:hypothetical protein